MRKRSAYRPKGVNPLAYLVGLQGATVLTREDAILLSMPVHLAVDAIRSGTASQDDWRTVTMAINVTEEMIRMKVARDEDGAIEALQEKISNAYHRIRATKSPTLWGDEVRALLDFAATYADLLSGVTNNELFRAQDRTHQRMIRVLSGVKQVGVRVL